MKSFKTFRDEIHHQIKTKKAGLEHPVKDKTEENDPQVGKELLGIKVPVEIQSELGGRVGNFILKAKEGKYSLEKGEK